MNYHYRRSSRSWVNTVFFALSLLLLSSEFVSAHLGGSADGILFMVGAGGLFFVGGSLGLLLKTTWELQIDDRTLRWRDSHRNQRGEVDLAQVKKVEIEGRRRALLNNLQT